MLAVAFALSTSLCWGVSDFMGGILTRRNAVLTVLLVCQLTGLGLAAVVVPAFGGPLPGTHELLIAVGAGVASVVGVGSLYKALAVGTMSVVAPIAATSALVPVLFGLVVLSERPSALQSLGIALAALGVFVVVRQKHEDEGARRAGAVSLAFAGGAALGFGAVQVCLKESAAADVWWTIGVMRVTMVIAIALAILATRQALKRPVNPGLLVVTGALDLAAATFFAAATTHGLLTVVAVLGSLYPVVTVLLARAFLGERLRRSQEAGVVAALAGVILVGAAA
jgi:drug/metabolite transporter (DMT)-like permease